MRSLDARVGRLEERTPVAPVGDIGTHAGRPWAEVKAEFDQRMAELDAERTRRKTLPLEERLALLHADHAADIAARPQRKPTIMSAPMAAVSDRLFGFHLADLEKAVRVRDGTTKEHEDRYFFPDDFETKADL